MLKNFPEFAFVSIKLLRACENVMTWRPWLRQKLGGPGGRRSLALVSQTVSFPLFSLTSSSSSFFLTLLAMHVGS